MGLGDFLILPLLEGLFPPPSAADEDGVVCLGGPLNTPVLVTAYYHGIFPWPHQGLPLLWFSPPERGVLEFAALHVPRSLKKSSKKLELKFTLNKCFEDVMENCASVPRPGQKGTWITAGMKRAYVELHEKGFAHSIEAWDGEELIGGIYGVFVAGVFSAESMFGLESDVSKLCLVELVKYLEKLGLKWMDIQMVTPVTGHLGGRTVTREIFLGWLQKSHAEFSAKRLVAPGARPF